MPKDDDEISMKDALREEFDRLEAGESENVPDQMRADRDDKGRFKPKEAEPKSQKSSKAKPEDQEHIEPAVEETPVEESPDQGSEPEVEPAAEPPLSAPDRWSAEWKAQFTTLPREAQKLLLDRESEYAKGFDQKSQEAANLKRQYEPLEQILAPRRQAWAMQGMDEGRAISQLLALSDYAANKPEEFIHWFASQRGINLAQPAAEGAAPAQPSAPDIAPIVNKVQYLEQTIQQQQQAEMQRQIMAFKSSPGHEHFEDVRTEMARMMQSGIATDMQDAYEKASWASPAVRAKILAAEKAQAESARKADEAKRVEAAKQAALKAKKAAGTTVTSKATLNGGAPAPASMREGLFAEYDRLHGAA